LKVKAEAISGVGFYAFEFSQEVNSASESMNDPLPNPRWILAI